MNLLGNIFRERIPRVDTSFSVSFRERPLWRRNIRNRACRTRRRNATALRIRISACEMRVAGRL